MKRRVIVGLVLAVAGVAVAAPVLRPPPTPEVKAAPQLPPAKVDTPMADRIATVGILNKRNGLSRDLRMRPGQAVRIGDAVIRLKACERTADWERDQLTGAFVQLIVHGADDKWRRVFSGWLFKETPSLNVVEHPIYDVWTKDCTMRNASAGPDSVILSDDGDKPAAGRSNARKSPATRPAPVTDAIAASSNDT